MSRLILQRSVHFGSFLVNPQVFHITQSTFALVNLKPLIPGHVLVSPLRVVPRLSELSHHEIADLFQTVQSVGRMIERVFHASALNIAIQDGKAAGQSVPHVHVHVIPRTEGDLDHKGGSDAIYDMMDKNEANMPTQYEQRSSSSVISEFSGPDADEERKPRSMEEMEKEAIWLHQEIMQDLKNKTV